jgi:chromosome segregation ATPase
MLTTDQVNQELTAQMINKERHERELCEQVVSLQGSVGDCRCLLNQKQTEISELRERVDALTSELSSLRSHETETLDCLRKAHEHTDSAEAEIRKLQATLENCSEHIRECHLLITSLRSERKEFRRLLLKLWDKWPGPFQPKWFTPEDQQAINHAYSSVDQEVLGSKSKGKTQ